MLKTLEEFLDEKTLYYDKIDYDVIRNAWLELEKHITLPYIIHIVGTNGKGSTGRFLASFLNQLNKNVLHYTSPHITKFNERIWINGSDSSDDQLNLSHIKLQKILSTDILNKLTYFEYTTLLALLLSDSYDYMVLEAGLGGEFDATNVVKNDITVVPSIGLDHMEFLGNTIEDIASTKLRSCDKAYILGFNINKKVEDVANNILKTKKEIIFNNNIILPKIKTDMPEYLLNNLKLSLNVLKHLELPYNNLKVDTIAGRFEKVDKNITIDVGHNVLAANVINNEFKGKRNILIYNSYSNKDYKSILTLFKDTFTEVQVIACSDEKIVKYDKILDICNNLNIKCNVFDIENMKDDENYLVFGSFKVVEEFLKLRKSIEK